MLGVVTAVTFSISDTSYKALGKSNGTSPDVPHKKRRLVAPLLLQKRCRQMFHTDFLGRHMLPKLYLLTQLQVRTRHIPTA